MSNKPALGTTLDLGKRLEDVKGEARLEAGAKAADLCVIILAFVGGRMRQVQIDSKLLPADLQRHAQPTLAIQVLHPDLAHPPHLRPSHFHLCTRNGLVGAGPRLGPFCPGILFGLLLINKFQWGQAV